MGDKDEHVSMIESRNPLLLYFLSSMHFTLIDFPSLGKHFFSK